MEEKDKFVIEYMLFLESQDESKNNREQIKKLVKYLGGWMEARQVFMSEQTYTEYVKGLTVTEIHKSYMFITRRDLYIMKMLASIAEEREIKLGQLIREITFTNEENTDNFFIKGYFLEPHTWMYIYAWVVCHVAEIYRGWSTRPLSYEERREADMDMVSKL